MNQADKRKYVRIKCRMIVETVGPTVDISAGGVKVLMANPLPAGAEVRLSFELPESLERVQCQGRVTHVRQSEIDADLFEVGMQFVRIMARHREAISQYVDCRCDERILN